MMENLHGIFVLKLGFMSIPVVILLFSLHLQFAGTQLEKKLEDMN